MKAWEGKEALAGGADVCETVGWASEGWVWLEGA